MSYPYVIQVYAFMPLSRALTTTRSSDNTKTYLRKGENFIRTQRSSTQNAFSILLPFLPTKSPTNMCIFSTDVLRFLKNETYFYLQAKKK